MARTDNSAVRHEYHKLDDNEKIDLRVIEDFGREFVRCIDTVASHSPIGTSRELELAKTKIEEAVMWTVKHITK